MEFHGLTESQVRESREKYGSNQITEHNAESFWDKLKGNFDDPIIKILCVALALNVVFAFLGQAAWFEPVGIALAVLLATFVSTYSEYRNENAFQKLQEEASLIHCKVYREGSLKEIGIDDLVQGDLILLQTGDKVPVDGVILHGTIHVDQSVLNGEAKEAGKRPMTGKKDETAQSLDFLHSSKVFRGSVVCDGNAVIEATTVGDKTVYGKIAGELQQSEERDTPLKLKLTKLAEQISMFGYIGGVAIAVAFMFQRVVMQNGYDMAQILAYCSNPMALLLSLVDAVMLAVIIIVVAVPEGLPLMIAIVSAQNMGKMLKDNVLVREISGIETAGSLNILFSDKTGTITKGQLEAVTFVDGTGAQKKSFAEIAPKLQQLINLSIRYNTSAVLSDGIPVGGNATERAIFGFVGKESREEAVEVVATLPFNSKNKYSLAAVKGTHTCVLVKGAPENILKRCSSYYDEAGAKAPLQVQMVNAELDALAERAIRVLALATYEGDLGDGTLPESGMTLVGAIGIRDEVRPESIEAIAAVHNAGVQVVMITGDRQDTATAIAREAGLLTSDSDLVLTSSELGALTDEDLKEKLPALRVVARALPSDKSRLVRLAQEKNLVVGMTGDGVNDSPALKRADVGFAMGGGTEVAKESSEIVILDDNFHSIARAILYGRTIFTSIRKFIVFQLTINVSAVCISFVMPLLGMENPLSITQFLWINLIMDTLAALAFGGEPALSRYMDEPPKRRDENIISDKMASAIGVGSLWTFVLSLFFLLTPFVHEHFRAALDNHYLLTGYFTFFVFIAVFNAFNARTDRMNLFDNIGGNKGFLNIMVLIVVVQIIMTYLGGDVLRCYGLTGAEWIFLLALAVTIIPVDLMRKLVTEGGIKSWQRCKRDRGQI